MARIFISYRREDSAGHAGRLFDVLRAKIDGVFMDVTGIEAGVDYVEAIERAVGSCDLLLVVIGREWLACANARGRRRLDDPNDFVRLETAAALERNIRVIPVLVEGAEMPGVEELPGPLKPLARRQALELRDTRWEADVEHLVSVVRRVLGPECTAPSMPQGQEMSSSPPPPTPSSHPRRWLGTGVAVAIVVALAAGVLWFLQRPSAVLVPELAGMTLEDAETALRDAGLRPGDRTLRRTRDRAENTVVDQSPAPGKSAPPDSRVDLTYAAPLTTMPGVVGLPVERAKEQLAAAGFVLGQIVERATNQAPAGQVLEQSPPPRAASDEEKPVARVVIATRPQPVNVPELVGLELDAAKRTLAASGLQPGNVTYRSTTARPAGTVLDHSPGAGTKLARGESVQLTVAQAPAQPPRAPQPSPPARVRTPDVGGKLLADATNTLGSAGLKSGQVVTLLSDAQPGSVLRQQPAAGEAVPRDSSVDLWIAKARPAPARVATRDVRGLDLRRATDALERQGLVVGAVTHRETDRAAPGAVVEQTPGPGQSARAGSSVALVLARAAPSVAESSPLPTPGDTWRYRYTSAWKTVPSQVFIHRVLGVTDGRIRESVTAESGGPSDVAAFDDQMRLVSRHVGGVALEEFSPYLLAFSHPGPGWSKGDIDGPKSNPFVSGWAVSAQYKGEETIQVPAGTFRAKRIDVYGRALNVSPSAALQAVRLEHRLWYAPAVKRVVKYERWSFSESNSMIDEDTYALLSYEVK